MSASDEVWILGIQMTKFGKHADLDTVDLAAEAATGALCPMRASRWPTSACSPRAT